MNPNLPELLLGGMAVWRVSAFLAYERGPFAIFTRIRSLFGINHYDDGSPDTDHLPNEFAHLLSCVWCLSPYLGLLWLVVYFFFAEITMVVSVVLALSTASVLIERAARG